jgi:hypothetical protein
MESSDGVAAETADNGVAADLAKDDPASDSRAAYDYTGGRGQRPSKMVDRCVVFLSVPTVI